MRARPISNASRYSYAGLADVNVDYIVLAVVAALSIAGGLYLLHAARQWRQRRDGH